MSVLKARRQESKLEVLVSAEELHKMLIDLIQRDFGLKNPTNFFRKRYERGDSQDVAAAKYMFFMHESRKRIDNTAALLTANLRAANSIYPKNLHELETRRDYQNLAIGNCYQIINELQHVVEIFDVDLNIYDRYIQAINREIGLIKRWRQRDNNLKSILG